MSFVLFVKFLSDLYNFEADELANRKTQEWYAQAMWNSRLFTPPFSTVKPLAFWGLAVGYCEPSCTTGTAVALRPAQPTKWQREKKEGEESRHINFRA